MADLTTLPIYHHADEIVAAVRDHQVVIVEGATGCGKTTQLPKILLRAGLVSRRMGITQPRRIAAVSVASRIAQEVGVTLGEEVGYAIRFDDSTSEDTMVKVMTDGILLQEARTDPLFSNYDIIMVDEAHERSLNIDFTLGLLHQAVRESDLRVIISSATLKPKEFQRFFGDVSPQVPLVSIDARPHPVDIQYRPPEYDDRSGICEAAANEVMRIHRSGKPGHILVFMPGEAMIRETLERVAAMRPGGDMVLLPLYGRLTREEQESVFTSVGDKRKVVVATNIAETSITIDGVRYVIDSGWAKVPRVQRQTGVTALMEEGISQASAAQRTGRAGRTAPGQAIRLYYEQDLKRRPDFTEEEILRLDLTDVVLRLIALGITDVEGFTFPTRPPKKATRVAIRNLFEMGAIDEQRELTKIGKRMVPFPLAPQLARMIVEAAEHTPDVVEEVLIVGAFLSARSPFLFPSGEEASAREAHVQLAAPMGDSITAVETFRRYEQAKNRDAFCTRYYLDPHIMAFIAKAREQLVDVARFQGIEIRSGGKYSSVVKAVATGFSRNIMKARGRLYEGPGDLKVAIHPSSSCFGDRHPFVVAAEIMVSTRAYARHVSPLEAAWIPDISPEVAQRFQVRRRKDKQPRRSAEEIPSSVRVGTQQLEVQLRRGRPTLQIPVALAPELASVKIESMDKDHLRFQGQLLHEDRPLGSSLPMDQLLGMLGEMPLPTPGDVLKKDVPQGALLTIERNLHTLGRTLDRLMECMLPSKGKRPGWLMLVANGGGAYWFEVCPQFPEAVEATALSLDDLLGRLEESDALYERVIELSSSWGDVLDTVKRVRAVRKRSRRR